MSTSLKNSITILGAMTGTSCDGMDILSIRFTPRGTWAGRQSASFPYPASLRRRVLGAQVPHKKSTTLDWLLLDRDLGDWYSDVFNKILKKQGKVDAIANHGQTVAHFPNENVTWQLGDPTRIAQQTKCTVLSHFRQGDQAAGGQGAPLVPVFHHELIKTLHRLHPEFETIAIHNLGGISNLSCLVGKKPLAFDTGPANLWIDLVMERFSHGRLRFDQSGETARLGNVDEKAVKNILKDAYFSKKPPKSTGRDDFPLDLLLKNTRAQGADLVATATEVTVESIAQAYEKWVLKTSSSLAIFFAGGGAENRYLLEKLSRRLPRVKIKTLHSQIAGLTPQNLESAAFAFLGYLSLQGLSLGGPWTGARPGSAPPAMITPGANWESLLRKLSFHLKK